MIGTYDTYVHTLKGYVLAKHSGLYNFKDNQQFVILIQKENTLGGNCGPEIEGSEDSGDNLATQYQRVIEILLWSVEVRRVDLDAEVSVIQMTPL